MTEITGEAGAGGPQGALSRMAGVLFSPAKTFESIGRKPGWDWVAPIGILILLTIVAAIYINPKLDTDTAIKETMKRIEARGNMSDAQKERTQQMLETQYGAIKSGKIRFLFGPGAVLIPLFFVSAVYLGIAKAMGAAARYGTLLAGYAYVQVPQLIKGVIGLGICSTRDSIDLKDVEHIVRSNVGSFLDTETTGRAAMTFLTSLDLFELWGVVLGSIMLARTTKLSKNAATVAVVGVWILYVLLKTAGAAIGGAFGG